MKKLSKILLSCLCLVICLFTLASCSKNQLSVKASLNLPSDVSFTTIQDTTALEEHLGTVSNDEIFNNYKINYKIFANNDMIFELNGIALFDKDNKLLGSFEFSFVLNNTLIKEKLYFNDDYMYVNLQNGNSKYQFKQLTRSYLIDSDEYKKRDKQIGYSQTINVLNNAFGNFPFNKTFEYGTISKFESGNDKFYKYETKNGVSTCNYIKIHNGEITGYQSNLSNLNASFLTNILGENSQMAEVLKPLNSGITIRSEQVIIKFTEKIKFPSFKKYASSFPSSLSEA